MPRRDRAAVRFGSTGYLGRGIRAASRTDPLETSGRLGWAASARRQRLGDEVHPILSEEHPIADEEGRRAEHTA